MADSADAVIGKELILAVVSNCIREFPKPTAEAIVPDDMILLTENNANLSKNVMLLVQS